MATDVPATTSGRSEDETRVRNWVARLARIPPKAAVLGAIGWVLAFGLLFAVLPMPTSRPPLPGSARLTAFFVVMIALYGVVLPPAIRSALASAENLSGIDESSRAELRASLVELPWYWLAISLGLGVSAHARISVRAGIDFASYLDPDVMLSALGLARLAGWLHIIAVSVLLALLLRHAVLFSRIGRRLHDVDLLDHGPLSPFVQHSFRTTGIIVVCWACIAAFHVRWEGDLSLDPLIISILPVQVMLMLGVFLAPLWPVHQALRDARTVELARVHAAIRGDREALRGSLLRAHADSLSPIDLFTYREQVQSFSSWPFDATAVARLALLTVVPLLGWIGGALVERALDAVLR